MSESEPEIEQETEDTSSVSRSKNDTILRRYLESLIPAFKLDCEMFLEKFEALEDFSFESFAKTWQNTKFTNIFVDQQYLATLEILCSICFTTIKKYIIFQNSLFIKLGALYLLYGLYYKCPVKDAIKIRLTIEEYRKINEFLLEMKNIKQYEPIYVFMKLKSDNAFHYVARYKTYNLELANSVRKQAALGIDDTFKEKESRTSITLFKQLFEGDFIETMDTIFTEYDTALKANADKFPTIDQFQSTIVKSLRDSYDEVFREYQLLTEENKHQSIGEKRRKLIQKSFKRKKKNQTKKTSVLKLDNKDISEEDD